MENSKGITIVALIVTVIILLLIAGILINATIGENGILNKSSVSSTKTKENSIIEDIEMAWATLTSNYYSNINKSKSEYYTINEINKVLKNGEIVELNYLENADSDLKYQIYSTNETYKISINTSGKAMITEYLGKITYKEYKIGEEVSIGNEIFYVIEDSDEYKATLTLFSKYNLDTTGSKQKDIEYNPPCDFSATNYWKDEFSKSPFNLNDLEPSSDEDAISKVRKYAKEIGANSGRLLTYEEGKKLFNTCRDIVQGSYAIGGSLTYWLGSAHDKEKIWFICGNFGENYCAANYYNLPTPLFGVRPVINVSKLLLDK